MTGGTAPGGPRVLHIITGLDHGGAERQLLALLRHLPVPCEVATLTPAGELAGAVRAAGVPVHEVGMRGNRDLSALPRLVRLIRRGRYDVVHTHLYRSCVYGRIAARLAGVPRIIATEHSLGDGQIEGRPTTAGVRALYRATERLGTATVAVSPTVARRLEDWGVPRSRVVVVPNGIDAAAFAFDAAGRARVRARLGIGPDEHVAGAVGRLVPSKRFDLLIEAFARLPAGRLLIAGAGPERERLEALARSTGAAARVVFMGGTGDVADALSAMDVFAAPSTQETFGLGVLEALASGLPVLYSTCPALDDVPAEMAPGACRLPAQLPVWEVALRDRALRSPSERAEPPPVVGHYSIATGAARLADLYRRGTVPSGRPRQRDEREPDAPELAFIEEARQAVLAARVDRAGGDGGGGRGVPRPDPWLHGGRARDRDGRR
ncbi:MULTISPECIES: glycosyltransferase [Thermomonosporaceae]|uniref:glycosyltransferase n=1 Tax=Thermomonosporaceae TaxID=2012 RepID=UPI00255AC683|nr:MULTISPECIES: glycosyltransferase [Thermomonosporaceae]MDL4773214.1 glycosyltransferase [Actinomadura xylanilytica]